MQVDFNPVLSEKQTLAWDALERDDIDEILYGGAKYGGKSWFLCVWSYLFACNFAVKYNIPKSDKPLPIGFLGRKVAKNFCDTTLETWFKTIPADGYVAKGNPVELIIDDRVKIHTGGLDNRETINKFNSAEYAFFAIDQAEEVTEDDVALLRGATFGRLVVNEQAMPGKGLFTANPRNCWLKKEFIFNPPPKRLFIPALPTDNPYCTQKYIDNLKDAFKHRPGLLNAYLHGDWSAVEGAEQVIKESWLRDAEERAGTQQIHKRYLVCDTARFGDDECVILLMDNAEIEKQIILPYCDHDQITSRLAVESVQNDDCFIVVESVGSDIGAAVVTDLQRMKKKVLVYTPQGKSSNPELFYNQRCEAWHYAAKVLSNGIFDQISNTPVICKNMDEKTKSQLCTPNYDHRGGKLLIESKKTIKERMAGNSPDRGDCYVIGLWAWPQIPTKAIQDRDISSSEIPDPMLM